MKNLNFQGCGEYAYDDKYDVLFFKVKERNYSKSVEMNNVVLDFDEDNFLIGVQIFDASEFLNINKEKLNNIKKWRFYAKIIDNLIEIRIDFELFEKDKIIEKNPIIIQKLNEDFPDSQLVCS